MALAAKLQLRQSQSLVMTPQLMQSIRLLQFSHLELERFVEEEMERNPLLERIDPKEDATDRRADSTAAQGPEREVAADSELWLEPMAQSSETMAERLDTSLENVFPDDPGREDRLAPDLTLQWRSASPGAGGGAPEGFDIDDLAVARPTLRQHLDAEIALAFRDPGERLIARELADSLDPSGYLDCDLAELAARLGVPLQAVEAALATCQRFEPVGLFARGLAECLSLQLRAKNRLDPAMQALLSHLDLLARRDFQSLRRICGVGEEDVLDMMAEIQALDPRPGLGFDAAEAVDAIVPDVAVRAASDGSWTVELNPQTLPRVLVDQIYFAQVSAHARSTADREFLSECLQSANWLTRSLDQRARTILKVATEIVRQQDAFLAHGVRHLRPLNLRAVADAIGMHESTVSRVTANKYMLTPRGVFELRYFFNASIPASGGGDAHSSEAVRDRIRQLIGEEEPSDVLSDDALVDLLKTGGVDIARRTVAKYREGMNIPSSVQRRREKRALAGVGR